MVVYPVLIILSFWMINLNYVINVMTDVLSHDHSLVNCCALFGGRMRSSSITYHSVNEFMPDVYSWVIRQWTLHKTNVLLSESDWINRCAQHRDRWAGYLPWRALVCCLCAWCTGTTPALSHLRDREANGKLKALSCPERLRLLSTGRNWIPLQAKHQPDHESRNGLLMRPNHHYDFDRSYVLS